MSWVQDNTLNMDVPKVWQLNASSTSADHVGAAPSNKSLFFMWLFWALIAAIAAVLTIIVFTGILRSRRVRSKSFNLYLVFLMIPDIIFSFFCSISCIKNMAVGRYNSAGWCQFQSIYCVFGIGANSWLNAVIARELYNMLLASRNCERYHPPKARTVILQSLAVYLWSFAVAMMTLFQLPFYKSGLHIGAACLPLAFDRQSEIFFYCFFLPCFALIPLIYSCWKVCLVLRNKLWPSSERARCLSIYFSRLIIVYLLMWLPSLLLLFVLGDKVNPWVRNWLHFSKIEKMRLGVKYLSAETNSHSLILFQSIDSVDSWCLESPTRDCLGCLFSPKGWRLQVCQKTLL